MGRTIKARFSHGVFEPLEKVKLAEGEELEITIEEPAKMDVTEERDSLDATFGAWADDIDCETLKKNIYADRQVSTPQRRMRNG